MMASTFDGDNQIVPLGMAICGIETEDNWAFFLRKLKVAIPATNRDGMIFMHDREKGLHEAQKTVFPRSYESICVYHLEKNVKVRFHSALEGLIWSAARAAGHAALESTLKKIEKISSQAAEYLRSSGLEKWTLAKFPAARFGKLTSNAAESMNAWIGDLRDGTPLSIILGWLKKVAVLFYKRRCHWKNETTPIPVHLQNSLRSSGNSAARRGVTQYSDHKYEVGGSSNAAWMVDLHARTCSCHLFQEMKIPCEHAAAVIVSEINMTGTSCKLWEFCDPIYLVSTIARVYASEFTLIDIGTISSDGVTMPNVVPARKGRPKKIRIRSRGEVNPDDQDTCGNCAGRGHNLRTCSRRIEALARAAARREPPRRKVECQLCHGSHYRKTPCRSNP
jgi:zinc finger SWIM domain-containing protein 3